MLLVMLQHKHLHISQQSVINIYSYYVNFLTEWRLSEHLMPRTLKRTAENAEVIHKQREKRSIYI